MHALQLVEGCASLTLESTSERFSDLKRRSRTPRCRFSSRSRTRRLHQPVAPSARPAYHPCAPAILKRAKVLESARLLPSLALTGVRRRRRILRPEPAEELCPERELEPDPPRRDGSWALRASRLEMRGALERRKTRCASGSYLSKWWFECRHNSKYAQNMLSATAV